MIEFLLTPDSEDYHSIGESYGIYDQNIEKDVILSCKNAIRKIKEKFDLFKVIKIVFVNNIGNRFLGRYRSQTCSEPIVMLSIKNLKASAIELDLTLSLVIETTIYHAIGIAICELEREMDLGDQFLEISNEDEWAENFAYTLYYYDEISEDLKRFIDEVNK